ncbi:efflux RND transporter periplasmic adaptor subunit [Rhodoferax sp.]|uniref:efflux RND transporter periplasmic adaptor subunit n=1 Tax=Rhodoferax sp. TaxID=50421 RepID=UPI00285171FB|nr:efflux RND transporter periplasmic adaptor subunit [Rhodoferax sp.]MDR3369775.1 efflux RND transporter periplasmic adaptor subunit [Rhodoferax sp.]
MTRNIVLFCLAVICGVAGWIFFTDSAPKKLQPPAVAPVAVTVAEVVQRELPISISTVGRTEAKVSVAVKSRLDGQVVEVDFAEGQAVKKGQLLMRFDSAVLDAQRRQAEGVLARDEAQLTRIKADYQRNLALVKQGFISQSGLSQSAADFHAAEANLRADRASLDNAQLQLSYTRITAPINGVAGALMLPVGGAAKFNDTTLLVINQIQPIYISYSLPESQLAQLKQAMRKADVAVRATVAGISQPLLGKLTFVDNTVDPSSGSITVKAEFSNADRALTPGQFAQVELEVGRLANALVVPKEAIESGVQGPYAYVVSKDMTVAIRQLSLGAETANFRVVNSGLVAGEQVVMTGQAGLRNNAKVTISATPSVSLSQP